TGGTVTKTGLDHCSGVALDANDNLYVGDEFNNRVMLFLAPLSNTKEATRVFGQPDFTSNTPNNPAVGGLSAKSINFSGSSATVAVDPVTGNMYVADALNNRVLEFVDPLNDSTADRVFGHLGDFTVGTVNNGGAAPTADTLDDVG